MTSEIFSALVRQSRLHREQTGDHLLTFADVEYRLHIDRAAERLILACVMVRFKRSKAERLN